MKKEEILGKRPIVANKSGKELYAKRNDALDAMDEYAKQQAALFFTWHTNKFNEYVAIMASKQPVSGKTWDEINKFENATIDGRYELFIESQTEQNDADNSN